MSNGKSPWEASESFNDELKRIDEMRRVEIEHLYSLIQTENRETENGTRRTRTKRGICLRKENAKD